MLENNSPLENIKPQEIFQNVYPKALADLYDLITYKYYDYPAALVELRQIIGDRGPLLEIGIGTGNMAIPLAQKGYEICGIDYSPSMVNLLEEKIKNQELQHLAITTQIAPTESFKFAKLFEAIYSYGGDPYLIQGEDQLLYEGDDAEDDVFWERLKNSHRHLTPGGLLVFNVQPEHSLSNTNLDLGNGVIFTTNTHFLPDNKLEKTYTVASPEGLTSFTIKKKRIPIEIVLENAGKIGFGNFKSYGQFVSLEDTTTLESLQNELNTLDKQRSELIQTRKSIYSKQDRSQETLEKLKQTITEIERVSDRIDEVMMSIKRFRKIK